MLLAQAEVASGALAELLRYGLLGIICVLLSTALVWVVKAWKGVMEQRVTDAQGYADQLKGVNDASNRVGTEIKSAVDELERTCSELKSTTERGFDGLTRTVDSLKDEQVRGFAAKGSS